MKKEEDLNYNDYFGHSNIQATIPRAWNGLRDKTINLIVFKKEHKIKQSKTDKSNSNW